MWRGLYRDHYLLGAQKDTMSRRKWLKVVSGAAALSSSVINPLGSNLYPQQQWLDQSLKQVKLKVGKFHTKFLPSLQLISSQETCSLKSPSSLSQDGDLMSLCPSSTTAVPLHPFNSSAMVGPTLSTGKMQGGW